MSKKYFLKTARQINVKIINVLMLLSVLVSNATGVVQANSADIKSLKEIVPASGVEKNTYPEARTVPIQRPIKYQTPEPPGGITTDPTPDKVPSRVPAKEAVNFYMVPKILPGNTGVLKLSVTVQNNTEAALNNLLFEDAIESGFEYQVDTSSPVIYNALFNGVEYDFAPIAAGESFTFDYFIKITNAKRNQLKNKVWLRNAELSNENLSLKAQVGVPIDVSAASTSDSETLVAEAGKWSEGKRIKVYMDAGSLG